jgi:Xaa-Pro aminopeptidase
MRYAPIDPKLFVHNRRRLAERLLPNSLAVLNSNDVLPTNADGTLPFVQNADLFYLSGIDQEESVLLLAPHAADEKMREVLFLRETNEHLVIWEGHKLTKEQATKVSGIENVRWLGDFPGVFQQLMAEVENVYLNTNEHRRATVEVETRDARFVVDVQRRYPLHHYHRLARLMHQLRIVKSDEEVRVIRQASKITEKGFRRVARFVKPGVNEMQVEAEFAHEFIRNGASFAYSPIVAGGGNSCVLHYVQNDQPLKAGEVLLLDVAAGYANYKSDLTRTLPVSGKFTRRQKQVYNAVLGVMRHTINAFQPGRMLKDVQKETEELMEKALVDLNLIKAIQTGRRRDAKNPAFRKYFMHGVAHPIGLDVHDVGFTQLQPIQPGWVLTCEPGIYIREEGLGIRLENLVHVTAKGNEDLLASVPVEVEEIEGLMAR